MITAKREDCKNQPLPAQRARLAYARAFDAAERARVVCGLVPEQREDKWFIFHESGWLYFHRSWTGICIYAVHLRDEGDGCVVEEAWVNRDEKEYREIDDAHDAALLEYFVDALLLGKVGKFPLRAALDPAKAALLMHHVVGAGRSNGD